MKKLSKYAALFVLAAVFASCNNNPEPENNGPEQGSSAAEIQSAGNFIKSKDDLTDCVKNIIKKYYDFVCEIGERNSSGRAAATQEEIANQLIKAFDSVYLPFATDDTLGKSCMKLFLGNGAETDIHLEGTLDLTDIKASEGVDAFIDLINHANSKFNDLYDEEEYRSPTNYTRKTFFGSGYETVNDFLGIADTYASVPTLYAHGELDVNTKDDSSYASGAAKVDFEIELTDINGLIPEFFRTFNNNIGHTYVPSAANLPVAAVRLSHNIDASAKMTKAQYDQFVTMLKGLPSPKDSSEGSFERYQQEIKNYLEGYENTGSFSCTLGYTIRATVSNSKDVPGGVITVSLNKKYDGFAGLLTNIITPPASSNPLEAAKELDVSATVTVTDYDGKQTFTLDGFAQIEAIINDIADNIGEIIQ